MVYYVAALVIWLLVAVPGYSAGGSNQAPSKKGAAGSSTSNAFSPERYRPDAEVPLNPERYIWKFSTKRLTLAKNTNEVPVYAFDDKGIRFAVGAAPVGETIVLEEFRLYGRRNFYRYEWTGQARNATLLGRNVTFWVDGMNIDYAGKK